MRQRFSIFDIKHRGFTLIELLVVISIISVLGSIVSAPFNESRKKGRDGKRVSEMKAIQSSLMLFSEDSGGCFPLELFQASPFPASSNYTKYISLTLSQKITSLNNYTFSGVISNMLENSGKLSTGWNVQAPYFYRAVGDVHECVYNKIGNVITLANVSASVSTQYYVPKYQLYTELETHATALDGDTDSNFSTTLGTLNDKGVTETRGIDISSPTLEVCTNNNTSNWDCVYDLSN